MKKVKLVESMMNSAIFIIIMLLYYIFLYYLLRAVTFTITWNYHVSTSIDILVHGITIVFVLLTLFLHDHDKTRR